MTSPHLNSSSAIVDKKHKAESADKSDSAKKAKTEAVPLFGTLPKGVTLKYVKDCNDSAASVAESLPASEPAKWRFLLPCIFSRPGGFFVTVTGQIGRLMKVYRGDDDKPIWVLNLFFDPVQLKCQTKRMEQVSIYYVLLLMFIWLTITNNRWFVFVFSFARNLEPRSLSSRRPNAMFPKRILVGSSFACCHGNSTR